MMAISNRTSSAVRQYILSHINAERQSRNLSPADMILSVYKEFQSSCDIQKDVPAEREFAEWLKNDPEVFSVAHFYDRQKTLLKDWLGEEKYNRLDYHTDKYELFYKLIAHEFCSIAKTAEKIVDSRKEKQTMSQKSDFYTVYKYNDRLEPGTEIKINHTISFDYEKADMSDLTVLSADKLDSLKEKSATAETEIFDRLCNSVQEWEIQAAQTLRIDRAIEYVKTPAVSHTANQWKDNEYGNKEISNTVFKMLVRIYEEMKYNRETKQSEPAAWQLSWSLGINSPVRNDYYGRGISLAGQDRKRFSSKAAMNKYLCGRMKAYEQYFKELSPPIPAELKKNFCVNGKLLPGYTVSDLDVRALYHPPKQQKQK